MGRTIIDALIEPSSRQPFVVNDELVMGAHGEHYNFGMAGKRYECERIKVSSEGTHYRVINVSEAARG